MKIDEKLYDTDYTVISIDGSRCRYKKCIGFCNNKCHKGFVTVNLLKQHECIQKKCTFLDPMEDHPFWIARAQKKKRKAESRKQKKIENAIIEEERKEKRIESSIIEEAKKYLYTPAKPILCKHLYGSTYFLVLIKCTNVYELNQRLNSDLNFNVIVKAVSAKNEPDIKYTYLSLLDEKTKEKMKKMAK